MGIDQLGSRIASAPRGVALALVALSVLVSPGFVRVSPEANAQLAPQRERGTLVERSVAIFELGCADGVYTQACLRFVARVTEALELDAGVTGPVRSLSNARTVGHERGALRLDSLAARVPATELGLRLLRARVNGDASQARIFVAPGEHATFVYAELHPDAPSDRARALEESLRIRFERSPRLTVTARSHGGSESHEGRAFFAALALALVALALVIAPGGWRAGVLAGLAPVAFALFAHALLGLLGEPVRRLAGFAPELMVATALAASSALIERTRASSRRELDTRAALVAAMSELGPTLAIVAMLSAGAFAALLVLAPTVPLAAGLGAAAGMATGLVVYPLGLTLAGIRTRPALLTHASGGVASALGKRVDRVLARPRVLACGSLVLAAIAICVGAALAPEPGAARLRSVVLDSGARGGALEPAFLERVQAFQRAAEREPDVVWTRTLVDSVVAPAYRATHDGDPVFAIVPPTRDDVVRALRPWQRDESRAIAGQLDSEHRRVAVESLVRPASTILVHAAARPLASTFLSLICVGALAVATLRSGVGGVLCALPGALTALAVLALAQVSGARSSGSAALLAPLAVGVSAAFALQLLARVRALLESRAEVEVALSLALREAGPSIASAALASAAAVAFVGAASASPAPVVALALLVPLFAAAAALALLPALVRASQGRFFSRRSASREGLPAAERPAP